MLFYPKVACQNVYYGKQLLWNYVNINLNKLSHNIINTAWLRSLTGEILLPKLGKFDLECLWPILWHQLSNFLFFFLTTELLFLCAHCRLCLRLGAINIYQDQLYILELRKIYLTTVMAVKKPLQSQRKGRKKAKACQRSQRGIFLLLTPTILPMFSLKSASFFLCPFVKCIFLHGCAFVGYWECKASSADCCSWRRQRTPRTRCSFKQRR